MADAPNLPSFVPDTLAIGKEAEQAGKKLMNTAKVDASKVEDILNRWFAEHMNNSPVARSVEAYHHVRDRLVALRELLIKELS
jgi:hypothetical protein